MKKDLFSLKKCHATKDWKLEMFEGELREPIYFLIPINK